MGRAAARRRSPAPPIIIIALAIAVIVTCWVFGRGCGSSRQARENDKLNAYTIEANKSIQQSATIAQQFNTLANGVKGRSKSEIDTQLTQMEKDSKSLIKASAKVEVPSKATDLQPLIGLALDLRARGVDEYHKGIMGVLNNSDRNAATQSISKALQDLVVSDQVLQDYRSSLDARLKAAKETARVADPGLFVSSIDSASTAAVNAYVVSITGPAAKSSTAATSPAQAMKDYLKSKGIDSSAMSFRVVSESPSDSSWKVDTATESGKDPLFFLLHGSNGTWTVIDYGTSLTAAKMKADGAPSDLTPP